MHNASPMPGVPMPSSPPRPMPGAGENQTGCLSELCDLSQRVGAGRVSESILRTHFNQAPNYLHVLACRFQQRINEWRIRNDLPFSGFAVAVALVCNSSSANQPFEIWVSTTYSVVSGVHPIQASIGMVGDRRYRFIPPSGYGPHAESNIVTQTGNGTTAIIVGIASSLLICTGCQGLTLPAGGGVSLPKGVELLSPLQPLGGTRTPSTCRADGLGNQIPTAGYTYSPAPVT